MTHVYGLGEQFIEAGNPNGDWTGRVRSPATSTATRWSPSSAATSATPSSR
ncbi:MAG: hypothetical protein MZW92_01695 [Comamonadaceae bacterium]|nr:hypothetical protein [Comamonadaceae bacterium]